MGLGSTPKGVFTALTPCIPMFFSTWETYHTHTLYLGYFNGPTGTFYLRSALCYLLLILHRGSDYCCCHDGRFRLLWSKHMA